MNSLCTIINDIYINNDNIFNIYKNKIMELYQNCKLSQSFRMTINEIKNNPKNIRISGIVLSGTIGSSDTVRILPDGAITTVLACSTNEILPGKTLAITIPYRSKLNITGMISASNSPQQSAMLFRVKLCWISDCIPILNSPYAFMFGRQRVYGRIIKIKKLEESTKYYICDVLLDESIAFDSVFENPITGTFIIDSEEGGRLCSIGVIEYALRRGSNLHHQFTDTTKETRAALKMQRPCVLWFTGLSGAGKSSIANAVEKKLSQKSYHTYVLDGDNIRHRLNRDLGFSENDRVENIRRIAEVAYLMTEAGLIVITATISPFRSDRLMARRLFAKEEFFEVYIDTPLSVAEKRDPKGLYAKARHGELQNFTGIDSPYEPPEAPEVRIDTTQDSIEVAAGKIISTLYTRGLIISM